MSAFDEPEQRIFDLIRLAEQALMERGASFGHGTLNAHDEAVWLTLWALGHSLDQDLGKEENPGAFGNIRARGTGLAAYANLLKQRLDTRKPLAYLTHEAWLQGMAFYVDERTIVPRSLIAEVIADGVIDRWLSDQTRHVLDLCTGGGSLAILAAFTWPDVHVDAADLSIDALNVARINIKKYCLRDRVTLIQSDGLAKCPGPYDLILCNPPYVNAASMAELPPEFRAEPALALAGGADGMDFIRALLRAAPARMSNDAVLVLEIGHERAHFEAAFPHLNPLWLDTSAGGDQVLLLTRAALTP